MVLRISTPVTYRGNLGVAWGFPGGSDGKESACNGGDLGSIPELEISPVGGHGNPLQYSSLRIPMDRGPGGLQSTGSQRVEHG